MSLELYFKALQNLRIKFEQQNPTEKLTILRLEPQRKKNFMVRVWMHFFNRSFNSMYFEEADHKLDGIPSSIIMKEMGNYQLALEPFRTFKLNDSSTLQKNYFQLSSLLLHNFNMFESFLESVMIAYEGFISDERNRIIEHDPLVDIEEGSFIYIDEEEYKNRTREGLPEDFAPFYLSAAKTHGKIILYALIECGSDCLVNVYSKEIQASDSILDFIKEVPFQRVQNSLDSSKTSRSSFTSLNEESKFFEKSSDSKIVEPTLQLP